MAEKYYTLAEAVAYVAKELDMTPAEALVAIEAASVSGELPFELYDPATAPKPERSH